MSNATVIQRMEAMLDSFSAQTASAYALEQAIEFHFDALEGIDLATVHRSREPTGRIVRSHFFEGEEEFGNEVDLQTAIQDLRSFLNGLPRN